MNAAHTARSIIPATVALLWSVTASADDVQIEAGAELYAEYCSNCHGENKTGLAEFSDDFATFTDRLEGMTEEMPDFAGFFESDEVEAMYAYLAANKTE